MADPLVSVITATFNRADFLPAAVESVLGQTYSNIEYHVIDDGSRDDTGEIVAKYLADPRFRYYRQENRGQSIARNVGLKNAQGNFICFLDSDNLWERDKLASQLEMFERHPEADVLYGDVGFIDEGGKDIALPNMVRHSGIIFEKLMRDNFVTFNTAMFRRRCYEETGGMDERLRRADDYDLWLRYSARYSFLYVPRVFGQYRVMTNQISHNKEARFEANRHILQKFMDEHPDLVDKKMRKRAWSHFYVRRARYRASVSDRGRAFGDLLTAMSYRPFSIGPWRALARTLLGKE